MLVLFIMTIEELTTLEKLNKAFYATSKQSSWKESTQKYRSNLLLNNLQLQEDVRNGRYRVSPTVDFRLKERGKERDIASPAIRDRVIQKVLCQEILIPQLTTPLIYDTYASLAGRGTAFARKRIHVLLQKFICEYGNQGYVLKIDIKKYFASVDHDILKRMIHERIHEPKEIMDLIDYVIDTSSETSKGLNLGAEAPQIFAIYYLSFIDSYIKTVRQVKYYGRYMDDMFIFAESKEYLWDLLNGIKHELAKIKLEINSDKTHIIKLTRGFTFLQIKYTVDGNKVIKRPTHAKVFREKTRLRKYKVLYDKGVIKDKYVHDCYKSWRNGLKTECNRTDRTLKRMDSFYESMFPEHIMPIKVTRSELIRKAQREICKRE